MDTKSKSFSLFSLLKFILVLIMIASVFVLYPAGSYLRDLGTAKKYSESDEFQERYNDLIHNITEYYVNLKTEENIKSMEENLRKDRIEDEYGIPEESAGTEGLVIDDAYIKEQVDSEIQNKLNRLYRIEQNLSKNVNFLYYIENPDAEEVYTNIEDNNPIEFLKNQTNYAYFDQYRADNKDYYNYNNDIIDMLKGTDYKVHTAVYKSLRMGDGFFVEGTGFNKNLSIYPKVRSIFIASVIAFILSLGILVRIIGRDSNGNIIPRKSMKVYNEIQIIIALFAIVILRSSVEFIFATCLGDVFIHDYRSEVLLSSSMNVFLLLGLSFLRQLKNKSLWTNTISHNLFKVCFQTKFFIGILISFIIYVIANGIIVILMFASGSGIITLASFLGFVAFNIYAFLYVQKTLSSLEKIMSITKEYSYGNYTERYREEDIVVPFRGFYGDIVRIKDGMKEAVNNAIKGERLKTELITNVSHDLKTPLTSIINYVDLLKREDLQGENTREYVSILEEKSNRLKQLIDDLLEASKASSGNLNVELQTLDLNELVQQSIGEYEDKLQERNIEIRANAIVDDIPILADGKHMWRIAENLFTNVIKYTMPYTRVYIETDVEDGYGRIIMKNVSDQALDISPEELTQRFVRGEESRTTEGSGLGLSIAESLTAIQGGKFSISIDGDLFKVTIEMPLQR